MQGRGKEGTAPRGGPCERGQRPPPRPPPPGAAASHTGPQRATAIAWRGKIKINREKKKKGVKKAPYIWGELGGFLDTLQARSSREEITDGAGHGVVFLPMGSHEAATAAAFLPRPAGKFNS